ncbi:EVE domain-containing protein [Rhodoferax saidenbachensis]|uniref:UPF0310 protein J2X15_003960 n=1 Tax=Rhodoferax saidenbachensis TaxID=1484693 RepID=A0ABU1ZSV8_9BURK|nr:EVE domain-containing protein [Rhodoferax saidenbachensis]MDR7308644.1 hypothetical protein [Rhodoferax saidenbachensis]
MTTRNNWIAVACAAHARRGCAVPQQGYMQVCHGKAAPLKRVAPGDRVAYYSPTVSMGGKDKLQAFVSIGIVQPGVPYAHRDAGPPQGAIAPSGGSAAHAVASVGATSDMGGGFVPYRRDVAYVPALEAPILPLLDDFEFVEDRSRWGYKFRFGLFQVSDADMLHIAHAMRASPELLYL